MHYQAAREAGIPRIDTLTAWRETELDSEAERAAVRYAEARSVRREAMARLPLRALAGAP